MADLPNTATSWDLTRMSRTEQVQMSRALIQSQMAATNRSRGLVDQPLARPLPGPATARDQSGPRTDAPVLAGMPLAQVPIQNVGPPSPGIAPEELPLAGAELAPLLSSDPLFAEPATDAGPTAAASPPAGVRVRTEIGQRHGVDLSNVPVDRSAEGASEAYQLRARAFTSGRGIVIPSQVGSLESGPGEALLAHELTHIAQRARYGPSLPDESTPAGRVLEADALATEMTLNNGASAQSTPLAPPGETRPSTWGGLLGDRSTGSEPGPPLPLVAPTSSGPDPESLAASILEKMSALSTPASGQVASEVFTPSSWSMGPAPAPAMTGGGVQRADEAVPSVPAAAAPAPANPDESSQGSMSRPSDQDLTNLSRWLYPLIRYKLKGELREDRERAGLLTDHYRRW
jgi:hypothetical protein